MTTYKNIIIPLDPAAEPNTLQIVIIEDPRGQQVIELNKKTLFTMNLKSDEWVKFSTNQVQTVKVSSEGISPPRAIANYICYTLTPEKKDTEMDPNCEYFIGSSSPINYKTRVKDKVNLISKPVKK